jgi:2-polyprenyl-3-methyl-5-hydroxy-6-metoxy-1,4-benzoquinol methylase
MPSVLLLTVWLLLANLIARSLRPTYVSIWLWLTDFILLSILFIYFDLSSTLATVFFALSTHLLIVAGIPLLSIGTSFSAILILAFARPVPSESGLFATAVLITIVLTDRALKQNGRNVATAISELARFTAYPTEKIREMWATSNQQLARNWESAKLDENDAEKMAEWYRENSELYMFAISAYNLEYKRIKSNLAMMRYGSGKCLDYGAGNGELILEMARRGHPAVYYDVEGTSMLFARSRAEQRGLNVEFYHAKDGLKESAARKPFDTIFSFDVLEHIPDLAGELDFLASLLAPGGLMVFDVPAGSTKAHPMHLNHDLNVSRHMLAKGMVEEKLGWSFRKQEKYLFRKPA